MSGMESYEDSNNSLPFIDETTDEETTPADRYNLKIIENYQNKNRNIEITNQVLDDVKSLSPVAPLAEETELSDSPQEEMCKHARVVSRATGMKLVIKGWNSTVSIQGLDNKSSLTFRRKPEKEKMNRRRKDKPSGGFFKPPDNQKLPEKQKKGRWKMLTRSLISKSTRFERRGLDERYPKYVLLKNEEGTPNDEDTYPKMVVFDKKPKDNFQTNFKKSFNNKTTPLGEMLSTKKPKTERSSSESRNLTTKKKIAVERRKSFVAGKTTSAGNESEMAFNGCSASQGQVFNEIQGVFEEALKLCPDEKPPQQGFEDFYASVPPSFCQFPCCHPSGHPPMYIPVYSPYNKPTHFYKNSNTQTNDQEINPPEQTLDNRLNQAKEDKELELQNLSFGILSSFFPRVVIMKAFHNDNAEEEKKVNEITNLEGKPNFEASSSEHTEKTKTTEDRLEDNLQTPTTLEVPQRNLSLKSKNVPDNGKQEPDATSYYPGDIYINCLTLNEISSSDEEHKTKTDDSETTEYLQFSENDVPGNESIKPTSGWESQKEATTRDEKEKKAEGDEETIKTLSLTKIGYKMYDNLTKLSLKREKEVANKPEVVSGRGFEENGNEKSPCNITLESNNRAVKVTVPDNELNFRFGNVEIGVTSGEPTETEGEERKIVRKTDLWHPNGGRKEMTVAKFLDENTENRKGCQKIKVSLAESKGVLLSIELDDRGGEGKRERRKATKEMKVGTDDFHLAGGDFSGSFGGNYRNLSPRTGQLLKNLQHKLELGEKERKFLEEKINEKLTDRKFQGGVLPGVFLVKQISPRSALPKKPLQGTIQKPGSREKNDPVRPLREYYCEECLATMRIFEDENPSVKSMVDKFETIIQLESY